MEDIKSLGLDPIPEKGIEVPETLQEIDNRKGVYATKVSLMFLFALALAIKKSLADGQITVSDAFNLYAPAKMLPELLRHIGELPDELGDTLTEEEQQEIIQVIIDSGIMPEKAEAVAIEGLDLLMHLKNFIFKNFVHV